MEARKRSGLMWGIIPGVCLVVSTLLTRILRFSHKHHWRGTGYCWLHLTHLWHYQCRRSWQVCLAGSYWSISMLCFIRMKNWLNWPMDWLCTPCSSILLQIEGRTTSWWLVTCGLSYVLKLKMLDVDLQSSGMVLLFRDSQKGVLGQVEQRSRTPICLVPYLVQRRCKLHCSEEG